MELVESLFNELRRKLNDDINHLEKQVMYVVEKEGAASVGPTQYQSFEFLKPIDIQLEKLNQQLYRMEIENQAMKQRLEALEEMPAPNVIGSKTPTMRAGGLEDLFIRTLASPPSPISESNSIVMPIIQRQVVIEEAEPDEEAIKGEVAAEAGGVDEDTEGAEEEAEEEEEEEEAEEEEEEETLTLEEFIYKGKNYYKTPSPDNKVYRCTPDGEVEDEPFAEYDEKNNRLVRISTQ